MKRVWKPLDVGGKRLYAVTLKHYLKENGHRLHPEAVPPMLVLAKSPRDAARIVERIYADPEDSVEITCDGRPAKVLMPEAWWDEGIPCLTVH